MVRFSNNKADFFRLQFTVLRGMKPGALPLDPAPCGGPLFFSFSFLCCFPLLWCQLFWVRQAFLRGGNTW